MSSILYDPYTLRVVLLVIAATLLVVAYFLHRLTGDTRPRRGPAPQSAEPEAPGEQKELPGEPVSEARQAVVSEAPASRGVQIAVETAREEGPPLERPFAFQSLQAQSSFGWDIARAGLILLAVASVATGALVAMSEPAFDRFASRLEPPRTEATTEKIAFLYLGDEVIEDTFHIRGVVRNISTENIIGLDANIRLYSHDSILLETAVARMDIEVIAPDAVAQFRLVYPNYTGQLGSYSVDFKMRQGAPVPFKDMRTETKQD